MEKHRKRREEGVWGTSTELFPDHAEWRVPELAHSARRGKWACLKGPSNNKHPLSMSPVSFESFGKIMTLSSQPCGVTMLPGVSQNLLSSPLWGCWHRTWPISLQCDGYAQKDLCRLPHRTQGAEGRSVHSELSFPCLFCPLQNPPVAIMVYQGGCFTLHWQNSCKMWILQEAKLLQREQETVEVTEELSDKVVWFISFLRHERS